ncbi:hypothetical protein [Citrobacter sp. RHB25-C09]|uniref:hypothetical protein n=1 Tax=Citrobacter sp. RHB25-C09 TaxID=2742624 RepID=UPI0015EEEBC0|nr:hypothetical protein [Citrobacter sp. RHB25-C09]QMI03640.1 hypothetical protein HVY19_01745 [Citrobacter sp. RHB25-C09]
MKQVDEQSWAYEQVKEGLMTRFFNGNMVNREHFDVFRHRLAASSYPAYRQSFVGPVSTSTTGQSRLIGQHLL